MAHVVGEELLLDCVTPRDITLSYSGISAINWMTVDQLWFEFEFGEASLQVPTFLAEFLSPRVAMTRKCDTCVMRHAMEMCSETALGTFKQVTEAARNGLPIGVQKSNFRDLVQIACDLGNGEMLSRLFSMIDMTRVNVDACLVILQLGTSGPCFHLDQFRFLASTVASKSFLLSEKCLRSIDFNTAQVLLSQSSLRIGSEDQLCDFIMERAQTDMRFLWLFEHVVFEELSQDRVRDFAKVAGANLSYLTTDVWSRVANRLEVTPASVGTDARVVNDARAVVSVTGSVPTTTSNSEQQGNIPLTRQCDNSKMCWLFKNWRYIFCFLLVLTLAIVFVKKTGGNEAINS